MKSYDVAATIAATPDAVWAVLADTPGWQTWDSGVRRVEGNLALGEKVKVVTEASPDRAFPVKVTELDPGRRMVWTGGMPLGLFKGVRTYTLSPDGDATRFSMREEYTGPLLPLIWRTMPDLAPSFQQFATGLKQRVERGA
jgi:hypothetical protein